jgi:hypothetical protein
MRFIADPDVPGKRLLSERRGAQQRFLVSATSCCVSADFDRVLF